jgi:hypothetical protein
LCREDLFKEMMSEREDVAAKRARCLATQAAFTEALAALEALPQQLTTLATRCAPLHALMGATEMHRNPEAAHEPSPCVGVRTEAHSLADESVVVVAPTWPLSRPRRGASFQRYQLSASSLVLAGLVMATACGQTLMTSSEMVCSMLQDSALLCR